jgi:hypothetical protein
MPSSARWLIVAGYAVPAALLAGVLVLLPWNLGRLGGAAVVSLTLLLALVIGALLILVGVVISIDAMRKPTSRWRWFDYLLLIAGIGPLAGVAISLFIGP